MSPSLATAVGAATTLNRNALLLRGSLRALGLVGLTFAAIDGMEALASDEAKARAQRSVDNAKKDVEDLKAKASAWWKRVTGTDLEKVDNEGRTTYFVSDGKGRGHWQQNDQYGPPAPQQFGPPDPRMYGPPAPMDLSPLQPAGPATVEMSEVSASSIGAMLADAFRSAVGSLSINVNAPSQGVTAATRGGKAAAPAPRVSNGQQYNGGN